MLTCKSNEKKRLKEILKSSCNDDHNKLKELFFLFMNAHELMEELHKLGQDKRSEAELDQLLSFQVGAIKKAMSIRSYELTDVLIKLAFWREIAPEIDLPLADMQPFDAIAFSAYIDLMEIVEQSNQGSLRQERFF